MNAAAPRHGGDRIAEALVAHGVPCIYTLCGGHISPILSAARSRGIRIVDVRDEATAVFAADAAARLTGRPGVAAVTAGPGITNTITALKNAQLAQSPVVLIGGAAPTALQGRGALQDIEQRPLVTPPTSTSTPPSQMEVRYSSASVSTPLADSTPTASTDCRTCPCRQVAARSEPGSRRWHQSNPTPGRPQRANRPASL